MEDSVIQQHLHHYKQATESAREDLAALQAKYQNLNLQLVDCRSKLSSQKTTVKDLKEESDRYKENEARQASLISSLRESIHNTEQEMISIVSSKKITDVKLQELTKENEDLKKRVLQQEIQSKQYIKEWKRTKQETANLQRKCEDFLSRLASKLSVNLAENDKPMDTILSSVELCCKERDRQKAQLCALEESIKSHEVESKASRETLRRLVADVDHEQNVSALRASDLNSARQELHAILLKKQSLEVDNKSLRNKLQENELALVAAREGWNTYEKRSQDLEQKLLRSQNEAQALHSRMESFLKQVQVLLGNEPDTSLPKEEHILERLVEVCRSEKSSTETAAGMEARLTEVLQELDRQSELHRAAEQKVHQLQKKMQTLELELLTAEVSKDEDSHEKQIYLKFLEDLSEKLKIEHIAADLGFDMRLEAILTRAEQLTRQEGTALVQNKTLVYSLQKKLKEQKQRLESKELHMDLLRRKVAHLDEEKRSLSALAIERDDTALASKKLQKKVARLQTELNSMRLSTTDLKAQLSHTNELKVEGKRVLTHMPTRDRLP